MCLHYGVRTVMYSIVRALTVALQWRRIIYCLGFASILRRNWIKRSYLIEEQHSAYDSSADHLVSVSTYVRRQLLNRSQKLKFQ